MQSSRYLGVVGLWIALGGAGCGGSSSSGLNAASGGNSSAPNAAGASPSSPTGPAGATSPTPGSEQTNVTGLQPSGSNGAGGAPTGAGTSSGTGGASTSACEPSACPAIDVNADGAPEPGCCTMAGNCGGLLEFRGMSFCAPPNAAAPVAPEPIVTDPRCVGQAFPNPAGGGTITLPGCCDASGICGVSTAGLAASAAGAGIPSACLTPTDLAGFAGGADAGVAVPCR